MHEPIERSKIDPERHLKPNGRGGWIVRIPLVPAPDQPWIDYFEQRGATPYYSQGNMTAGATVHNGVVEFATSEENFDKKLEDVDQRIRGTNRWYAEEHLPSLNAARKSAHADDPKGAGFFDKIRGK